jgi:signal transduction histidine kinase/CheY-like chemotaxis protein
MPDTKASILLVDDRPDKLLALEAVLEDLNQKIVLAYSGREALRHVLEQDFAVILLDVNMPGMDGFETASLIRQRNNSRHTPIIFITAFGDEMHASRGYSLGAVDYILAPVLPEVLRTKVAVFVELFVKTQQIKKQAESLERRAMQMQKLAAASMAINSSLSTEQMLRTITDTAREIIGAHQAIALYTAEPPSGPAGKETEITAIGSFSEIYADWRSRPLKSGPIANTIVARVRSATRLTEQQLDADWKAVSETGIPSIRGEILAAPLTGRNGTNFGLVYLSDRYTGEFTQSDEAILVQLAQIGSVAIENTIYAQERQANRIKDEFLATLSHELRTPLNAILGWTQLMQLEKLEGDVAHGVEVIDRSAKAQTKLIEDLLDMSRITSGKLQLSPKRATLGPIVSAAVDASRPAAEVKHIQIDVRLADEDLPVMVDPDRMQQVVWNLLSNAVKFTPMQGSISVDLRRRTESPEISTDPAAGPWLSLRVSDTGRGIDPTFLPFVFDRFRQADSTSTRGHGGLGIGLAIVRQIVEQHGGRVVAASEGQGRGTTMTVELPTTRQAAGGAVSTNGTEIIGENHSRSLDGIHVLVVDDDTDSRDMVSTVLRRAGAKIQSAGSVAEAIETMAQFHADLLLSDIAMPDEDGFALIQKIRQRPRDKGGAMPAIALTAYAREEDRARVLAAGFDAHLSKPVVPRDLLAAATDLISTTTKRKLAWT